MGAVKIPESEYLAIVKRVMAYKETLQSIADDYGVTRERIRQIAAEVGVTRTVLREAKLDAACRAAAEDIIRYREMWMPVVWSSQPVTNREFDEWVKNHPELNERWEKAKRNPMWRVCNQDGRICVVCKVWKPWDEFYNDKGGVNGHSQKCIECAKREVKHYYDLRDVQGPTVTEKRCPGCRLVKPADEFWLSSHNTTGLQSYCKDCHREFARRAAMKK